MDSQYWTDRWKTGATQWDIGEVSPAIKDYIDGADMNRDTRILIPGCGSGYEGAYLHELGFKNVYLSDISNEPLEQFHTRHPTFPKNHLLIGDLLHRKSISDMYFSQIKRQQIISSLIQTVNKVRIAEHAIQLFLENQIFRKNG